MRWFKLMQWSLTLALSLTFFEQTQDVDTNIFKLDKTCVKFMEKYTVIQIVCDVMLFLNIFHSGQNEIIMAKYNIVLIV